MQGILRASEQGIFHQACAHSRHFKLKQRFSSSPIPPSTFRAHLVKLEMCSGGTAVLKGVGRIEINALLPSFGVPTLTIVASLMDRSERDGKRFLSLNEFSTNRTGGQGEVDRRSDNDNQWR